MVNGVLLRVSLNAVFNGVLVEPSRPAIAADSMFSQPQPLQKVGWQLVADATADIHRTTVFCAKVSHGDYIQSTYTCIMID